ncbi:MAG: hypothetical protein ACTSUE_00320 [Promethearchaeota archaeon]
MSDGTNDFVVVKGEKIYLGESRVIKGRIFTPLHLKNLGISSPDEIEGLDKVKPFSYLYIEGNQLKELPDLSGCPWIRGITAHSNKIEKISGLAANNQLEWLGLNDNPLENIIGIGFCDKLELLEIKDTPLESLEGIENCRNLREACLCNNKLKDI